jgi:hypothetical protein
VEVIAVQDHLARKANWYKAKSIECAALAKSARPNFVREIYRKAAVHYDVAEGLLRRRGRVGVAGNYHRRNVITLAKPCGSPRADGLCWSLPRLLPAAPTIRRP